MARSRPLHGGPETPSAPRSAQRLRARPFHYLTMMLSSRSPSASNRPAARWQHEGSSRRGLAPEWTQRDVQNARSASPPYSGPLRVTGFSLSSKSRPPKNWQWGHDHDGAYRQLPLDDPRQAYVLLLTPEGSTLWSHNVLLFGSAASVWSYNRFGDVLVACSRTPGVVPGSALRRRLPVYGGQQVSSR